MKRHIKAAGLTLAVIVALPILVTALCVAMGVIATAGIYGICLEAVK